MFKLLRIKSWFQGCAVLLSAVLLVQCSTYNGSLSSTAESSYDPLIEKDIEYLASDALEGRQTGTAGEKLAAAYISKRFKEIGLMPKGTNGYFQDFSVNKKENPHEDVEYAEKGDINVRNVVGYLDNGAPFTVVIGAHYDHLGHGMSGSLYIEGPAIHNGADDNASGVAGLLYLAKALQGKYTSNNYMFIAFSGEEYGLWGSNYFTKNPTIDLPHVTYMLNMDMIGRMNDEGKLSVNGVGTSPAWDKAMKKAKVKGLSIVTTEGGMGASDHTSFYLSEVPALHFFTGQHMDYHKPSDDEEKINYKGISMVMDYMMAMIANLDGQGDLVFTETKSADDTAQRSFKVTLGVMPDYLYDGEGMRIDGVRPDRPAAKAGIIKGDIVLQMDSHKVEGMEGYMDLLTMFEKGQTIKVKVKRDKQILEKEVSFD